MGEQILDNKREALQKTYIPTYERLFIHPEEGEDFRINTALSETKSDLITIDKECKEIADKTDNLLKNTITRLNKVKQDIINEKERLMDIKMLCNKYTDFDNVHILDYSDFTGNFSYDDKNVFTSEVVNTNTLRIKINDVYGNGYEGNKYVYKDFKYIKDSLDTSKHSALNDNTITSYWEYSRITASSTEKYLLHDFNMDSEEAKCTISIESSDKINELNLLSEANDIQVIGLQYSDDNIDYTHEEIPVISINKKDDSYSNYGYIYGSGKLAIPSSKYVKVTLQSLGYTDDVIAYERKISEEYSTEIADETTIIKTARRHVIKINDLYAYKKIYSSSSVMKSKELISNKVYSIALFCNIYIPEGLNENCLEFILTVNGIDYTIQPINSNINGIKVIRFSQGKANPEYTEYVGEYITSAYLTIKLKGSSNLSPYVNNVKILLGGEI